MPNAFSAEELVAAYLLHLAFSGEALTEKMTEINFREEVKKLSKDELKKLLEEIYGK